MGEVEGAIFRATRRIRLIIGALHSQRDSHEPRLDETPLVPYKGQVAIVQTGDFRAWLNGLRDAKSRLRIDDRLKRLAAGHAGDTKSVGDGVRELRFHFGPGYRVYYTWQGDVLIILLNGGDKDSQKRDIALAKQLAREAGDGIEGLSV